MRQAAFTPSSSTQPPFVAKFSLSLGAGSFGVWKAADKSQGTFTPKIISKYSDTEIIAQDKEKAILDPMWFQIHLCGHTLRSWLNQRKQLDDELPRLQVGIVKGLVEGLQYLHLNNIMHRNFQPENIYFSQDYSLPIKIGHFGLSSPCQVGTWIYTAPEALLMNHSFQADLLSLGLVMWEVMQLIGTTERESLFDTLVNTKAPSHLVKGHPQITNGKELIVHLTRPGVAERARSLLDMTLQIVSFHSLSPSSRLQYKLDMAQDGDTIDLEETEYLVSQPLLLRQNYLVLRGKGEGTLIINTDCGYFSIGMANVAVGLRITGNNCQVLGIKVICTYDELYTYGVEVVGSCNLIQDIHFQGGDHCLMIQGDENILSNLAFSDSKSGMYVVGNGNKLDNIRLDKITNFGVWIQGDKNLIARVTCGNVRNCVDSKALRLRQLRPYQHWVIIYSGSGNIVDSLKCEGFSVNGLTLFDYSSRSIISNSVCYSIWVSGFNHTLVNVDGGKKIEFDGRAHRLEQCRARKYINHGIDVTFGRRLQFLG